MKIKELRKQLNAIPKDFDDKEIVVKAENEMLLSAKLKKILKNNYYCFNSSANNVEKFIITWE